jgi:quercetin dioxygenase-like cupin family protein
MERTTSMRIPHERGQEMDVICSRPPTQHGPSERFTGDAWIDTIAFGTPPSRLRAYSVHFTPSARTAWHRHPNGQVLHVTEGVGRVQAKGSSVREIRAGDSVVIEAGEWHWHGASPNNFMTHLGLVEVDDDGSETEWGRHVTDEEYLATPAAK